MEEDPDARSFRVEYDSLGEVRVPADALYGAHTARSVANFPLTGTPIGACPDFISVLARIKHAACLTNDSLGLLPPGTGPAIRQACLDVANGQFNDQLLVDVLQGGAGTSTNMNINEVIANRALQILERPLGDYHVINPINHVNRCQSTNDAYATAVRLCTYLNNIQLVETLQSLAKAFRKRTACFEGIVKLGRTQLQDAVPMPFSAEIESFATTLEEDVPKLSELGCMFLEINMGGTAVGSGVGATSEYCNAIRSEIANEFRIPVQISRNLYEASWDVGAFVLYCSMLKRLACKLSKIANDLRLLSSGPRGGLGELILPERQAGSSLMPGKVNPVIPEAVNQVAFRVFGIDISVTFAAEAGQLQLNAFEPMIFWSVREASLLLEACMRMFENNCVEGLLPNCVNVEKNLENSMAEATVASELIGYEASAKVARLAIAEGLTWKQAYAQLAEHSSTFQPSRSIPLS